VAVGPHLNSGSTPSVAVRNIDFQSVSPVGLQPAESRDSGQHVRWAHKA
jgi:hypothetical protein